MRTLKLFALATLMIATSCNKEADWQCKCDIDGQENIMIVTDVKKKEARSQCKDLENNTHYTITNCKLAGKDND